MTARRSSATRIVSYKKGAAFLNLSPRSRDDYRKMLDILGGWLGPKDASRLVQSKTGARLYIPVTQRLQAMLDAARPVDQAHGERPILGTSAYTGMEMRFRRARARAGLASGVSLHGLRKNATIELAEAGCTEAEIKAITGHETSEMVALYSKGTNQRRVAKAARLKTEIFDRDQTRPEHEQNEIGKMSGKTRPTTV